MKLLTRNYSLHNKQGQSLIEVLIGVGVGVLFISATIGILVLTIRIHAQNRFSQSAGEFAHGLTNQLSVVANTDWHALSDLVHSSSSAYHLTTSGNFFIPATGTAQIILGEHTYTHWFTVEDVYRDSNGGVVLSGGTLDPSTLKTTSYLQWSQAADTPTISFSRYITRNKSRVFNQTNWADGSGQEGPINATNAAYTSSTNIEITNPVGSISIEDLTVQESSSTGSNIDATYYSAWNDVIGWIDFKNTNTVTVSSTGLTGYASSNIGSIALDCATSPSPNCTYAYQVDNDGTGVLSGFAWNDVIGWISFASSSPISYGVSIDEDGYFSGYAWNDVIGWISFNCSNTSTCATSNYKVKSNWSISVIQATLLSSIFDTEIVGGAAIHTIMWQGTKPTGTSVQIQIATSNSSNGPWTYVGPNGTDTTYYEPAGPNIQTQITQTYHTDQRYVRYKLILESDENKTYTPQVDDIIIGWSP